MALWIHFGDFNISYDFGPFDFHGAKKMNFCVNLFWQVHFYKRTEFSTLEMSNTCPYRHSCSSPTEKKERQIHTHPEKYPLFLLLGYNSKTQLIKLL